MNLIRKRKICPFYADNLVCKKFPNCEYNHPKMCKFQDKCKFKNSCKFIHPNPPSWEFPALSATAEINPVQRTDLSFSDICEHFKNGKMIFKLNDSSNFEDILLKIKKCLETKTTNIFILER
jgi:hypothetical protein